MHKEYIIPTESTWNTQAKHIKKTVVDTFPILETA